MAWHKLELLANIERIAAGMAVTRPDGTVEHANRYLHRMLGTRPGESIELPFARHEAGGSKDPGMPKHAEAGFDTVRVRDSGGAAIEVLYAVWPLRDDAGAVTHFVHFLQPLGDERWQALRRLAFYDALTTLPNRNLFTERLAHALTVGQRRGTAFAVLYIDIDHFKRINDEHGHEAGDDLLREVAARLAASVRASDTVARWGGDEFVALLDGVADPELAARIVSKLLEAVGKPYVVAGRGCRITVSVGLSFYPRDGRDAQSLLRRADGVMFEVKARGRNGYRIEQCRGSYACTAA